VSDSGWSSSHHKGGSDIRMLKDLVKNSLSDHPRNAQNDGINDHITLVSFLWWVVDIVYTFTSYSKESISKSKVVREPAKRRYNSSVYANEYLQCPATI
jgi:hypothetical protein